MTIVINPNNISNIPMPLFNIFAKNPSYSSIFDISVIPAPKKNIVRMDPPRIIKIIVKILAILQRAVMK
ncbi:MAG: hypothetical protein LBM93_15130, partial [Oscillospiraceae bacterium]|nr:hypothetical protein [Oscillospiraceae bacterium]